MPAKDRRLHFWEAMICVPGKWENARHLTRGAGAQLILSIPHGAVKFAVLKFVRRQMNNLVSLSSYADVINRSFGPGMDFISSAISTVCCSVVSTPQMMICDNIMAGTYGNLLEATKGLMKDKGLMGFYGEWWAGIAGKIHSYGLTWTLFEQIKRIHSSLYPNTAATDVQNSIMGCLAIKLFSHGRGLAAHLHAVHTPWNPDKAEMKRQLAVEKRMENEQKRLHAADRGNCHDVRPAKREKLNDADMVVPSH
ncbi:hypothetical protein ACHAXN_000444 [Cyclotella atomus]